MGLRRQLLDIQFWLSATMNTHHLDVQSRYFNKIVDGSKTVEGRVGEVDPGKNIHEDYITGVTSYHVGDQLRFTISGIADQRESALCEITKLEFFSSFEEMLNGCGLEQCLPGVDDIQEGGQDLSRFSKLCKS